jgi:hypothetical protein
MASRTIDLDQPFALLLWEHYLLATFRILLVGQLILDEAFQASRTSDAAISIRLQIAHEDRNQESEP